MNSRGKEIMRRDDNFSRKRVVVIGAGVAGITLALELAKRGKFEVTLVNERNEIGFSPCLLPYYIAGEVSRKDLFRFGVEDINSKGIEVALGSKLSAIDVGEKIVKVETEESDGKNREIGYDVLCLCVGATKPKIKLQHDGSVPLTKLQNVRDADRIIELAGNSESVAIIGSGLIGLEVSEALKKRGLKVVMVEAQPTILPALLDSNIAEVVEEKVRGGVEVVTGVRVLGIKDGSVLLEGGKKLKVDFAVNCTGFVPDLEMVRKAGIECDVGIIVDDKFRTNIPSVYACGDCAEVTHFLTGKRALSKFAPSAAKQAMMLARIIGGEKSVKYAGFLENWISVLDGFYFGGCGLTEKDARAHFDYVVSSTTRGKGREVVKLVCSGKDGKLLGLQAAGRSMVIPELLNLASVMIRNRASVYDVEEYMFNYHPLVSDVFHIVEKLAMACRKKLELK